MQNFRFYLYKGANTWFSNNERRIADWASFCQDVREILGTPTTRSDMAKRKLFTRLERSDEMYASYIEDILAL